MSETPTLAPPPLAFPPLCPTVTVPPTKIADETWVIHQVQQALRRSRCRCTSTRW